MNPWVPVALGILGAAMSALAAYAIARRQRSGRIDSSEAETLWAEGQAMRQELRLETVQLRAEVLALRSEAVASRNESASMRIELATLREESVVTHAAMTKLRDECSALTAEMAALRTQMAEDTERRLAEWRPTREEPRGGMTP